MVYMIHFTAFYCIDKVKNYEWHNIGTVLLLTTFVYSVILFFVIDFCARPVGHP